MKIVHSIAASALGPTGSSFVQDVRGSTVLSQFHYQEGKFFSERTGTFKYSVFGDSSWCPGHSWLPLVSTLGTLISLVLIPQAL